MQVNIKCGDCGGDLGTRCLKGSKQMIEVHACAHSNKHAAQAITCKRMAEAACEELEKKVIDKLAWLVTDAKWRHDEIAGNVDAGSQGGYSKELTAAIEFIEGLK